MSLSRTLLRATAQLGLDAGDSLRQANRTLCSEGDAGLFVTTVYVIVNTRTGAMEYATGGHFPPYIVRKDRTLTSAPQGGGMVIGIMPDATFDTMRAQLEPGDLFLLYSDGVTEAANAAEEFFGDERLEEALVASAGGTETEAVANVADRVRTFAAGFEQSDDITIVSVRYGRT
jgi:sigma-B regulation protein RsbU (phosphoserine phosphatase)